MKNRLKQKARKALSILVAFAVLLNLVPALSLSVKAADKSIITTTGTVTLTAGDIFGDILNDPNVMNVYTTQPTCGSNVAQVYYDGNPNPCTFPDSGTMTTAETPYKFVLPPVPGTYTFTAWGDSNPSIIRTIEIVYEGGPTFVGNETSMTVHAGQTDLKNLLHANDTTTGKTLTWSQNSAPSNGTLNFTGATAASGSSDVIPGGTITYTPTAGFHGTDNFTVQVSDGTTTATKAITVNVDTDPLLTYSNSDFTAGKVSGISKTYRGVTFTAAPAPENDTSIQSSSGFSGIYSYDSSTSNGTELTLTAPGYSFDVNSFLYHVDGDRLPTLTITATYANGSMKQYDYKFSGNPTGTFSLNSFTNDQLNDAVSVKLSSDQYIFYNDFSITDIKSLSPNVTTSSVTSYTGSSAAMGGSSTSAVSVTDRGVVYSSTDPTPAIGNTDCTKVSMGSGTGSFSGSVTGLSAGKTYYVRAYAVNSYGTSYGSAASFTTANSLPSGKPTISGVAQIGNTLTASPSGITDADGLGTFSYQWQVSDNGTSGWANISSNATASSYKLTASEAGKYARVQVSYTDDGGTSEAVCSDAFGPNKTSQAAITYNNVEKTYGDSPFTLTASGGSSSNSFQYSSSDPTVATIDSSTGLVTIKKSGTVTLTASKAGDSTYTNASADCTLTVNKATLTATVANYSKTYGDANPAFTVNVDGFKNGETASMASGYVAPTASCSATTATPAGAATIGINSDGKADNYVFNTDDTGTLSIKQRQVTLTAAATDITYNGNTDATGTISVGNTVNGDTVTASGTFAFDNSNAGNSKTVHVTDVTLGGTGVSNYTLGSSASLTATANILKKALQISTNPVTVYCGQSVSSLPVNVSGFENGESAASLAALGFALPTASPASIVDTSSPVTNADLPIEYTGGNSTGNYIFDCNEQTKLTVQIPTAEGHYSVSPAANSEGWYKNDITITPTSGFDRISTDGTTWSTDLTISSETSNGTVHFMLKNSADGTTTGSKAFDYKLDKTKPTGMTVKVKDSGNQFTSFLNTITFGLCFQNTVSVTLSANDVGSSIAHYEYQLVDTSKGQTYRSDGTWLSTNGNFSVSPQFKGIVYARAVDKAGNVSDVVSSNGFVLDNQAPTGPNVTASVNGSSYSGGWTAGNIQLTASGAAALSGIDHYEYKIGRGSSWAALQGSGILTVSTDVDDEIHFRAVNKVNTAGSERIVCVKRDSALPHVQVSVSGTTGQWTDQPVEFTLSNTASNRSPVTYWVKIGSADWAQLSGNKLTVSKNTNTTYEFRAVSASGTASSPSAPYTVKIAGATLKETINKIDALPNPATASDKEVTASQQDIKGAKILYDSLQTDEKAEVGTERSNKLNNLIYRLNALLVIIPKDPDTKVAADNLGTSVNLSELSDPNVGKVTVNLTANPIPLNGTSSEQHRNIAIASSAMSSSDKTILAAFDVSLFKTVYDLTGAKISNGKISNTAITAPITIRIPVPAGYTDRNDLQVVYIDDAGNVTPFATTVVTVDGTQYLQFTTTHFSVYAVTALEQKSSAPNPDTGDNCSRFPVDMSLFELAVLSISAGSILFSKRKLRKLEES